MSNIKLIISMITVIFMIGCYGTNLTIHQKYIYASSDTFSYEIIEEAKLSEEGMAIFKMRLESKLKVLKLISEEKGTSNKLIEITFNNYYMRHGAARALAGVMTGVDNITSTVLIKDKDSDTIVGKFQVVSENPTAVISARALIEEHADKIANYIKTGKK